MWEGMAPMSDDEIVKDFLVESYENLDRLDRDLVGLEKNPQDRDALAGVFRTIHTIKGTCGFLGFNKLEKVAHVGENLLTRLRDRQLTLNPEITTGLLGMVDAVRQMLKEIESTGRDGDADYPELRETLARLLSSSPAPVEGKPGPTLETPSSPSVLAKEILSAAAGAALPKPVEPSAGLPAEDITAPFEGQEERERRADETPAAAWPTKQERVSTNQQISDSKLRDASSDTIRVGVNLLDKLMTLVGELVLARNQLLQLTTRLEDNGLQAVSQRMNLIATELQEEVMKTRMQPIGNIWGQFPRTVRDVALGCGKQVNIEMEGKETELDKTIIEAIKDPLTHLVRNSVDHGIELPEVRVKAGKEPAGRLILRAFHEGGQVNIEISDDGAGLNGERIRKKAVERGLITAEHAARMPEREVFNLIFLPGFSTAEKVTNVSGRGVGMDVVKTNVSKLNGTVEITSHRDKGSTFTIRIPLTLAIIQTLMVRSGSARYAVPLAPVEETLMVSKEDISEMSGTDALVIRGKVYPLFRLTEILGTSQEKTDFKYAVVVNIADKHFCIGVDELLGQEEVVIKSVAGMNSTSSYLLGATITGDGRVVFILDLSALSRVAMGAVTV
jgi:two-component system chemotaxis sensor kinase CheA